MYHSCDGENLENLFPGSVIYKNSIGGTVITFAGSPVAEYYYTEGFAFLNATRKNQLIGMLESTGNLPVYYPGDAEMYVRAARLADNRLFVALFNLSFDPVEETELVVENGAEEILRLNECGEYEKCSFRSEGNRIVLDLCTQPMLPVALVIKQAL